MWSPSGERCCVFLIEHFRHCFRWWGTAYEKHNGFPALDNNIAGQMASFIAVFNFLFVTGIAFIVCLSAMLAAPGAHLTILGGLKLSTRGFSLKNVEGTEHDKWTLYHGVNHVYQWMVRFLTPETFKGCGKTNVSWLEIFSQQETGPC